jgi:FdhD protein
MSKLVPPSVRAAVTSWRGGKFAASSRALPEETAIAITYNSVSFAVMMATPDNLEDFAIGFSISEGIVTHSSDITGLEIIPVEAGIECRMSLTSARRDALESRRRKIAGPVGCGLCGIDSLHQAVRPVEKVSAELKLSAAVLADALRRMSRQQILNHETRAVHAAAFFNAAANEILLREDVGRHNALDKVIGAAERNNQPAGQGAVLLTSRVSIELIQKTAIFGAPILAAISVPTARAVREAEAAGITLIAIARDDGFEIFTHPDRIIVSESQINVA